MLGHAPVLSRSIFNTSRNAMPLPRKPLLETTVLSFGRPFEPGALLQVSTISGALPPCNNMVQINASALNYEQERAIYEPIQFQESTSENHDYLETGQYNYKARAVGDGFADPGNSELNNIRNSYLKELGDLYEKKKLLKGVSTYAIDTRIDQLNAAYRNAYYTNASMAHWQNNAYFKGKQKQSDRVNAGGEVNDMAVDKQGDGHPDDIRLNEVGVANDEVKFGDLDVTIEPNRIDNSYDGANSEIKDPFEKFGSVNLTEASADLRSQFAQRLIDEEKDVLEEGLEVLNQNMAVDDTAVAPEAEMLDKHEIQEQQLLELTRALQPGVNYDELTGRVPGYAWNNTFFDKQTNATILAMAFETGVNHEARNVYLDTLPPQGAIMVKDGLITLPIHREWMASETFDSDMMGIAGPDSGLMEEKKADGGLEMEGKEEGPTESSHQLAILLQTCYEAVWLQCKKAMNARQDTQSHIARVEATIRSPDIADGFNAFTIVLMSLGLPKVEMEKFGMVIGLVNCLKKAWNVQAQIVDDPRLYRICQLFALLKENNGILPVEVLNEPVKELKYVYILLFIYVLLPLQYCKDRNALLAASLCLRYLTSTNFDLRSIFGAHASASSANANVMMGVDRVLMAHQMIDDLQEIMVKSNKAEGNTETLNTLTDYFAFKVSQLKKEANNSWSILETEPDVFMDELKGLHERLQDIIEIMKQQTVRLPADTYTELQALCTLLSEFAEANVSRSPGANGNQKAAAEALLVNIQDTLKSYDVRGDVAMDVDAGKTTFADAAAELSRGKSIELLQGLAGWTEQIIAGKDISFLTLQLTTVQSQLKQAMVNLHPEDRKTVLDLYKLYAAILNADVLTIPWMLAKVAEESDRKNQEEKRLWTIMYDRQPGLEGLGERKYDEYGILRSGSTIIIPHHNLVYTYVGLQKGWELYQRTSPTPHNYAQEHPFTFPQYGKGVYEFTVNRHVLIRTAGLLLTLLCNETNNMEAKEEEKNPENDCLFVQMFPQAWFPKATDQAYIFWISNFMSPKKGDFYIPFCISSYNYATKGTDLDTMVALVHAFLFSSHAEDPDLFRLNQFHILVNLPVPGAKWPVKDVVVVMDIFLYLSALVLGYPVVPEFWQFTLYNWLLPTDRFDDKFNKLMQSIRENAASFTPQYQGTDLNAGVEAMQLFNKEIGRAVNSYGDILPYLQDCEKQLQGKPGRLSLLPLLKSS
jgi:hypothetical protein